MTEHTISTWHGTHIQECSCGEVFFAWTRSESVDRSLRHVGGEFFWEGLEEGADRMRGKIT